MTSGRKISKKIDQRRQTKKVNDREKSIYFFKNIEITERAIAAESIFWIVYNIRQLEK